MPEALSHITQAMVKYLPVIAKWHAMSICDCHLQMVAVGFGSRYLNAKAQFGIL
jgi:hypothetical protein